MKVSAMLQHRVQGTESTSDFIPRAHRDAMR